MLYWVIKKISLTFESGRNGCEELLSRIIGIIRLLRLCRNSVKISVVIHELKLFRYIIGIDSFPRKQWGCLALPITKSFNFSLPVIFDPTRTEIRSLLFLPVLNFFPFKVYDLSGSIRQNKPNSSPLKISSGLKSWVNSSNFELTHWL